MMITSYEIIQALLNILRVYAIFNFMNIFYGESEAYVWKSRVGYTLFYLVITAASFINGRPVMMLFTNLILLFALSYLYKSKLYLRILHTISIYLILVTVETVIVALTGYLDFGLFERSTYNSSFGYIVIQVATFLVAVFCSQWINIKNGAILPISYWFVLILLPVTSLYVIFNLFQIHYQDSTPIVLAITLLLASNLCVFHLYDVVVGQERERLNLLIDKKEADSTRKQIELVKTSSDNIRQVRHDMKNHLLALETLMHSDKGEEVKAYIAKLLYQIEGKEGYVDTGNLVPDGLLNLKLMEAQKHHIKVKTDIKIPVNLNISSYDWTVILGNVLDNAIEANLKVDEEKRVLNITLQYNQGRVFICVNNAFDTDSVHVDIHNKLMTTKKNKSIHGLGLESVYKIVKAYHGLVDINYNQSLFMLSIILFVE